MDAPGDDMHYRDWTSLFLIGGVLMMLVGGAIALWTGFLITMLYEEGAFSGRFWSFKHLYRSVWILLMLFSGFSVAVVPLWLGYGLVLCRRWAYKLTGAVLGGFLGFLVPLVFVISVHIAVEGYLPKSGEGLNIFVVSPLSAALIFFVRVWRSPALQWAVIGAPILFSVMVGGFWLRFGRQWRTTCLRRDPVPRWTDPIPVSLFTFCVLLAMDLYGLVWWVALLGDVPLFGYRLAGVPGIVLHWAVVAIALYLMWGLIKLRPRAWWGALALVGLGGSSAIFTLVIRYATGAWGWHIDRSGFNLAIMVALIASETIALIVLLMLSRRAVLGTPEARI